MMPSSRAFYAWLLTVSVGRLWHMVLARSPSFSMGLYHLLVVLSFFKGGSVDKDTDCFLLLLMHCCLKLLSDPRRSANMINSLKPVASLFSQTCFDMLSTLQMTVCVLPETHHRKYSSQPTK